MLRRPFLRGFLGLPLAVAIIGGEPRRFRLLIDLYREVGLKPGHSAENDRPVTARSAGVDVSVHSFGFVADSKQQAADDFYPPYAEIFGRIGKERGWPPINRAQFDAVWAEATLQAFSRRTPGERV